MTPSPAISPWNLSKSIAPGSDDHRDAAKDLEGQFLAEMLRHAGFADALAGPETGLGGESFSSLLVDIYAERLAAAGGLGLSDRIAASLEARMGERS